VSTPDVEEQIEERPWRTAPRPFESPPAAPLKLNRAERREAIRYWQSIGVLDERGQVADRWKTVVGSLFG